MTAALRRSRWIHADLRRATSLLAGPYRRSTRTFVRRLGLRVQGGPLAGLQYPRGARFWARGLLPRLAGTYEQELHAAVEQIASSTPSDIVDIGVAEGFYLVGFARRCPSTRVIGFEQDPYLRDQCRRLATANGVERRIELRGVCRVEDLATLDVGSTPTLLADCEGAEAELVDPARVPWLSRATLVIEVHDHIVDGVGALLEGRLAPTHDVRRIVATERFQTDAPPALAGLPAADRLLAVNELRRAPGSWLWATPTAA